jgi:hypothetical protein
LANNMFTRGLGVNIQTETDVDSMYTDTELQDMSCVSSKIERKRDWPWSKVICHRFRLLEGGLARSGLYFIAMKVK